MGCKLALMCNFIKSDRTYEAAAPPILDRLAQAAIRPEPQQQCRTALVASSRSSSDEADTVHRTSWAAQVRQTRYSPGPIAMEQPRCDRDDRLPGPVNGGGGIRTLEGPYGP